MCDYRTCKRCEASKPITHFGLNKGNRRHVCRECVREHNRRREKAAKLHASLPENFEIGTQFNRWRWKATPIPMW